MWAGRAGATAWFYDSFEAPDGGFPGWTSVNVNGANTVTQTAAFSVDGGHSLGVFYKGTNAIDSAYLQLIRDAGINPSRSRIYFQMPVATYQAMALNTEFRLLRMGDTQATNNDRFSAYLRKNGTGTIFLRVVIRDAAGGITTYDNPATTWLDAGVWEYVEGFYDQDAGQAGVVTHRGETSFTTNPLGANQLSTYQVGLARGADPQGNSLTFYVDEYVIADDYIGPVFDAGSLYDAGVGGSDGGLAVDGGADGGSNAGADGGIDGSAVFDGGADAGADDGGTEGLAGGGAGGGEVATPEPVLPEHATVRCGCDAASSASLLALVLCAAGLRRRRQ